MQYADLLGPEALTFDDVLLVPGFAEVLPNRVSVLAQVAVQPTFFVWKQSECLDFLGHPSCFGNRVSVRNAHQHDVPPADASAHPWRVIRCAGTDSHFSTTDPLK